MPAKVDEAREMLEVALRTGAWPVPELRSLIVEAIGCDQRTVEAAAKRLRDRKRLETVRRIYWVAPQNEGRSLTLYLEGHDRKRLIGPLLPEQAPSADPSDIAREQALDEWRDLMGAVEIQDRWER